MALANWGERIKGNYSHEMIWEGVLCTISLCEVYTVALRHFSKEKRQTQWTK